MRAPDRGWCCVCGSPACEAHHRRAKSDSTKACDIGRYEPDEGGNVVAICRDCHSLHDAIFMPAWRYTSDENKLKMHTESATKLVRKDIFFWYTLPTTIQRRIVKVGIIRMKRDVPQRGRNYER